jgi:hypothetical protein
MPSNSKAEKKESSKSSENIDIVTACSENVWRPQKTALAARSRTNKLAVLDRLERAFTADRT